MYLVEDWCVIKCIHEPKTANIFKIEAFTLPGFDEESFPFIAVCGYHHISIVNIATFDHKPLTNGMSPNGKSGLRFAFAMGDLSEIQVHYALTIQDRDGHGKKLVQYNRLTLKYDLID